MFYKGGNIITTGDTVNEQFATETVNARKADAFGRKVIITEQKFNNQQVAYLEKMIDLCKSNDIELTFIETPKYISVDHDDKYPGMMVQFVRILEKKQVKYLLSSETEKVLKENTNLQFKYMGETVFFEADNVDNFIDYVHLSTNGRKKYTQNLTESIKKEMSVEVKK